MNVYNKLQCLSLPNILAHHVRTPLFDKLLCCITEIVKQLYNVLMPHFLVENHLVDYETVGQNDRGSYKC
jgi:hypothetical protein